MFAIYQFRKVLAGHTNLLIITTQPRALVTVLFMADAEETVIVSTLLMSANKLASTTHYLVR